MHDGFRDLQKRRRLARSGRRDDGNVLECVQRRREARNLEGALVVAIDHAEVQRDGMSGPSRHALEGRDVGRHRRDQPRRNGTDVVVRRKAQPNDEDLGRGVDRGGGDLLIPLRSGRHYGLERTPFGDAFPRLQHLDGKVFLVQSMALASFWQSQMPLLWWRRRSLVRDGS